VYARSSERVVQALIYVESNAGEMPAGDEGQQ
jgi:hypothetical protein